MLTADGNILAGVINGGFCSIYYQGIFGKIAFRFSPKWPTLLKRMRSFFALILLLVTAFPAFSQDWKSFYDRAVSDYKSQHYQEALIGAEKAYMASKSLDVKNQSFTLQLLTSICLEMQDYNKGLGFAREEVKLFAQTEGTKSSRYVEALEKRAQIFQALSQWKEARADFEELLAIYSASDASSFEYLRTQNNYGQVLLAQGENDKAAIELSKAISGLKKFPDEKEEYTVALFYLAIAETRTKNPARAEARLQELLSLADKNGLQSMPQYAEAKIQLAELAAAKGGAAEGLALVEQGNASEEQKAVQYLKAAMEFPDESAKYFKLAEEAVTQNKQTNNTAFSIYQNHARYLFAHAQLKDAQLKLDKATELAALLYPPTSVETGYVLELQADIEVTSGNAQSAFDKYLVACQNFSLLPVATQASHRVTAGVHLLNAGRPDLAKKLVEEIAGNYTALFSLPEKVQLDLSTLYSEALLQLNQNDAAIKHLQTHLPKATSVSAHSVVSLKLAESYQVAGEWKKAETLFESVVKKPGIEPSAQLEALYQLARLRQQLGKYKNAEENYQQAIATARKLKSPELNQVYNSFATFYIALGNYSAAETIYRDLLGDAQTTPQLADAVKQNLAAIYEQTLRYDLAEKLLMEVLEDDRKTIGEKHPDFAISLQNLGALYQAKGNFEKARSLYQQALDVDKANGGVHTLTYANTQANLGTVYEEMGDLKKANELLESSLTTKEKILGREHPDFVYTVYNLAVLKAGMGELDMAAPYFQGISEFYLKQIKEVFPTLSDYEKTAYINTLNRVIDDYEEFVVRFRQKDQAALGQLFNFRLETKALLLNASVKVRNAILSSGQPELQARFAEWLQLKEKLAHYYSLTLDEKRVHQKTIDENQQKANQLEKWLSTQSEQFGKEFNKQTITWQDVRKALKPAEAAVEIIRVSLEKDSVVYAALIIRPESTSPAIVIFKKGKQMEGREFSYYRNTIRYGLANERSYALFWEPMESVLKGISTVYLSADGIYNKVNPLTFFDARQQQYVVDRLTVRLLSNLRELTVRPDPLSATPSASLFGFPDFRSSQPVPVSNGTALTRDTPLAEIVQSGVADLPGTKIEVQNIEALLRKNHWRVSSFMNKDASEEKIKSIKSPDILHIATHGFFIPEKDEGLPYVYSKDVAFDNPLTHSGLLLAGVEKLINTHAANDETAEDGILTALEVMNLNLDHTDLVILSACETGSGKIRNGEGVYGLQRAFLVSGANNLVMSLWKVSDEATEELMIGFYTNFLISKDKAAAFRKAQLDLKKKYDAPFYWGAFVLIGR
jgi:CHAT domain-containing protein/Tfp pilus assembly protein PilF